MTPRALLLLALLAAVPAAAQTTQPNPTGLREVPGASAPIAPAARIEPWSLRPAPPRPDPSLISPGLQSPAAPRMEGLGAAPTGGSACRTACATSFYQCGAGDGNDQCGQSWSACVLACPAASGAL